MCSVCVLLMKMTEIEVGFMKIMNSCLICVVLMKMLTPQIEFGMTKVMP